MPELKRCWLGNELKTSRICNSCTRQDPGHSLALFRQRHETPLNLARRSLTCVSSHAPISGLWSRLIACNQWICACLLIGVHKKKLVLVLVDTTCSTYHGAIFLLCTFLVSSVISSHIPIEKRPIVWLISSESFVQFEKNNKWNMFSYLLLSLNRHTYLTTGKKRNCYEYHNRWIREQQYEGG